MLLGSGGKQKRDAVARAIADVERNLVADLQVLPLAALSHQAQLGYEVAAPTKFAGRHDPLQAWMRALQVRNGADEQFLGTMQMAPAVRTPPELETFENFSLQRRAQPLHGFEAVG